MGLMRDEAVEEECQFAKFGFEKLENANILEKVGSWLVGYYHPNNNAPIPCLWFVHDGSVNNNVLSVPNLTPLKKEWYEDESNFPCLCHLVDKQEKNKTHLSLIRHMESIPTFEKDYIIRLATKEEVLSLYRKA